VRLHASLLANIGVRYDYYDNFGSSVNPRAALIYTLQDQTAFKLLYGTAFRAPSDYELHAGVDRAANPKLEPEEITSYKAVVEHYIGINILIPMARVDPLTKRPTNLTLTRRICYPMDNPSIWIGWLQGLSD
jgi:hypothetical protein